MANFYSAEEAAAKLGKSLDQLTQLAREGKLREFRDAGKVTYRADEVDALARGDKGSSGELVLEPGEGSGLEIAMSGSDVLSLEEVDSRETADETRAGAAKRKKEGTVVPSVGVSVFDDDELDEVVDPLAQTQVTDGIGLDGVGSGSGILDLTRESDETSLGAELLDEISPADDDQTLEMGEDTRAGLEAAIGKDAPGSSDILEPVGAAAAGPAAVAARRVVEYGPDAFSSALTGAMVVATLVLLVGGLSAAAMVRSVWPAPLGSIFENMPVFGGVTFGGAILVALVTYLFARRR
ncbi:MAG: DNA-binding protein [Phycisphaerales bacterium]|nr:MAG: DNA-binding protein [Phycisphaerales bacterium]